MSTDKLFVFSEINTDLAKFLVEKGIVSKNEIRNALGLAPIDHETFKEGQLTKNKPSGS